MIFFPKKAIFFIIFITAVYVGISQANFLSQLFLQNINNIGVFLVFYPNFLTNSYIVFYKNLNSLLLVSIFLLQYLALKIKIRKNLFFLIGLFSIYCVNNILSFSGVYWNSNTSNVFWYIYIGTFISFLFISFLKAIIYLVKPTH